MFKPKFIHQLLLRLSSSVSNEDYNQMYRYERQHCKVNDISVSLCALTYNDSLTIAEHTLFRPG